MGQSRRVAVALVIDDERRLLLGKRPESGSLPGFWEFPGGKVEENEEPTIALTRELTEEVGIMALDVSHLRREENRYGPDWFAVDYFLVTDWSGEVSNDHYVKTAWVSPADLGKYRHLTGNQEICAALAAGDYDDLLTPRSHPPLRRHQSEP